MHKETYNRQLGQKPIICMTSINSFVVIIHKNRTPCTNLNNSLRTLTHMQHINKIIS